MQRLLPAAFYECETIVLARRLLGQILVHSSPSGLTSGIIVETEAYLHDDPACHAARGLTKRNAPMFGPPGRAYVYFIYGCHYCFNVTSAPAGRGEAVLIRALEPLAGLAIMQARRRTAQFTRLTSGPGKLCQAMGINLEHNNHRLDREPLVIVEGDTAGLPIAAARRIGVRQGRERLLRFYISGNRFVSQP